MLLSGNRWHGLPKTHIFECKLIPELTIMKQILLITIGFVLLLGNLNAQLVLQASDYFPVAGDSLKTATDNAPIGIEMTAPGGNQTWNFSSLQSGFGQVRLVLDPSEGTTPESYPTANVLLEQIGGGEGYYESDENAFSVIGFAGEDPIGQGFQVNAPFDPPYVERWAPLAFFDLRNNNAALRVAVAADDIPGNLFEGLPITPDSIRVNVNTNRTDLVDGWGTLMIPGGTYDVLREKRTEYRSVTLETKIGSFPWTDITGLALSLLMIDELGEDTLITYSFWSDTAKEPIAIVSMNNDETAVTSVEYKDNDVVSSNNTLINDEPTVYVYPNPAMVDARFEYTNMPAGRYTLSLYNLAGKAVWSKDYQINDYLLEKVNVTHLPKGIYLYVLRDEQGRQLTAKRLIVTKP